MANLLKAPSHRGLKRWVVLAAGVVIQIILGGEYAWSVFSLPLMSDYGFSRSQCGLVFGAIVAVFSLVMFPAGRFLVRRGPRLTAGIGSVLFAIGFILASFSGGSYLSLLLSLGIFTGSGIAFAYMCPIAAGMKWFPQNKGLVTGVSVAGFGAGAIFLSHLAEYLLETAAWDVLAVFRVVGIVYGLVALAASMFISDPPDPLPEELAPVETGGPSIESVLRSRNFWFICLGMVGGTFAGLLTVGHLKPLALSFGLIEVQAAWSISIFALGNTAGRILWGQLYDRLGSRATMLLSLGSLGCFLLALVLVEAPWAVLTAVFLIGTGFGSCFVVYASALVDIFGLGFFPRLYPVCFLGYGVAALISPASGGALADLTGSYQIPLSLSAALVLGVLAILWIFFKPVPSSQPAGSPASGG